MHSLHSSTSSHATRPRPYQLAAYEPNTHDTDSESEWGVSSEFEPEWDDDVFVDDATPEPKTDTKPPDIPLIQHQVALLRARLEEVSPDHPHALSLKAAIQAKDRQLRDAGVSKTTAARVFAIPELLEKILLELDLHTSEGLGFTNAANAIQLCRLEKVNRDFRETITGSKRLLGSREPLQVDKALLRRRRERKQRHEVSIECSRKESSRKVF
ncbi:hypothetical protein CLAFUW4_07585 [Fulvia fulva]|uniref:Uncharacterized protein n=1 Tax=Passalora fulva TaxID=5499 RepID=A0A9Q8UQT0_PASFU|nr:uncharacterized protein CLAFUR5_07715 [Fulvia fulva]KAK4622096.1 hypothetical protein CLAFUR4_07591 [Fulvia fulva]KAK4623460.1 hypothetical protein CLAFUR0_07590 [Fulvia fulva]UJO19028.1 hypothetical protein CLAFUR5_07715 [Fulvia fulva]WPV15757.1 hypothetical protein CLAFUW4_07585 [Fulvia fulva]WPV31296.1 hypothetical protein CLAFUW7_07587 [Fulvia fulva]